MIRILHVYPQLNNAGTEMVIRNLFNNIDTKKIMFDFLVQKKGELDDLFIEKGSKIFYIENENYEEKLKMFFSENSYSVIHTHTHKEMGTVLKVAAKCNIPVRIAHSHNYRGDLPKIVSMLKMFTSWNIEKYSTHFIGCSKEALKWLFPRNYRKGIVWNNGVEIEKFLFNAIARTEYRNTYKIDANAKVICHVGRFSEQKNHKRIIQLLNKLQENDANLYGVLVGVGPLLEEMKADVLFKDRVLFLGNRSDVANILSMSDLFIFPSLYEGLGIVGIEAQVNGLNCVASTNVPKYADLKINRFVQVSLDEGDEIWINTIIERLGNNNENERGLLKNKLINCDYDIHTIGKNVEDFYLSVGGK